MSDPKLRVVVVDDQEGVRAVVADTVRFAGHDVVATAADGREALECCRQHRPDVVIMDVQMPGLNGADAMEIMLREGLTKRVVLMSGEWRSLGLRSDDLRQRGAAAFLEKPFSVTQLFQLLDEYAKSCAQA
ncbi:MAG: response regulator [Verrucomicrobiae bacterium]|nr:response regulator [Verrucomicrobiae bacterium]MDW8344995.1 response regulator [Verrucomicrobiae bacterium]